MTFQITIIGLNPVGQNLGLALSAYPEKIEVLGCDRDTQRMKDAKNLKCVYKTESNLHSAVADADLIILNESFSETLHTIDTIAPELDSHRYLFDLCPGKTAINQKLVELVPDFHHHLNIYITANPTYLLENPQDSLQPKEDAFAGGLMMVAGGQKSSEEAVDLAITISKMLKSRLIFSDPQEMDGLSSSAISLPLLNAAAMVNAVSSQPGWREARKLTGSEFYRSSASLTMMEESGDLWIANRENMLFWINQMKDQLDHLTELLSDGKVDDLIKWQKNAIGTHLETISQRTSGEWEAIEKTEEKPVTIAERLSRLVGFRRKK